MKNLEKLVKSQFGYDNVVIKKLVGYENENYRVLADGRRFILKIYPFDAELRAMTDAETEVLLAINPGKKDLYPVPVSTVSGAYVEEVNLNGVPKIMRLLTFVEGEFVGDVVRDDKLFDSLGAVLANLDKQLMPIVNYSIRSRVTVWDIQHLNLLKPFLEDVDNIKDRHLLAYFIQQFEREVDSANVKLRKSMECIMPKWSHIRNY